MTGWINVKDKIPEIGQRVLVYQEGGVFGGNEIDITWRDQDIYPTDPELHNRIVWDGQGIRNYIYWWMPLPEPPKD